MLLQDALVSTADLCLLLLETLTGEGVQFRFTLCAVFLDLAETLLLQVFDLLHGRWVLNGLVAAALRGKLLLVAPWTMTRCVSFRPVVGEEVFGVAVAHELGIVGGKESVWGGGEIIN